MKHFCVLTFKQKTRMDIAHGIKVMGVEDATSLIQGLPDDHYMCKAKPADKDFDPVERDEFHMPKLIPKQIKSRSPEEQLILDVKGALRYASNMKVPSDAGLLTTEQSTKYNEAIALIEANTELIETF